MDTRNVLEEYEKGDDGKRLDLFLTYRDLREQFSTIDQAGDHDEFVLFRFPWSRKRRLPRAA